MLVESAVDDPQEAEMGFVVGQLFVLELNTFARDAHTSLRLYFCRLPGVVVFGGVSWGRHGDEESYPAPRNFPVDIRVLLSQAPLYLAGDFGILAILFAILVRSGA